MCMVTEGELMMRSPGKLMSPSVPGTGTWTINGLGAASRAFRSGEGLARVRGMVGSGAVAGVEEEYPGGGREGGWTEFAVGVELKIGLRVDDGGDAGKRVEPTIADLPTSALRGISG